MIYNFFINIFNYFKNNMNISCLNTLHNLLNIEKKYIKILQKSHTHINIIKNKQSFIIDINNKYFFNITSHSYIIFPKQSTSHILLIHGGNSGPSIWFENAITLAEKGFIVHCISLPAFGGSTVSNKILNFSPMEILIFYSNYIAEYITFNVGKNNPPQIVSHSIGSYITCFFASKHPKLCKSITIVNGSVFNVFGKNMFYWGLFFKYGFPNYYAKKFGYIINYLFFQYLHFKQETNLLHYIQVLEMTCREIFGELILSKLISFEKNKLKMDICVFPHMISTNHYPPISIICSEKDPMFSFQCNDLLSKFYTEKNEIIKIDTSHNPINHPDFSTYVLESIQKPCKLLYINKFDEIKQITDNTYSTYSSTETNKIMNQTYHFLLHLLEKEL
jgi:pimeloyl-ACP methyl ester carboxylesterase